MKNLIIAMAFILPFMSPMNVEYSDPVSPYTYGDCIKEEVPTLFEVELPYFIETYNKGGYEYITEDSLSSICMFIGSIYEIDPVLLQAIAFTESSYRVDPNGNGLCQVITKSNEDRIKKLGIRDIADPYQNVLCCADLMRELLDRTDNDITFALMSYNCGYYRAKELYPKTITGYPRKVLAKYKQIKGANYE